MADTEQQGSLEDKRVLFVDDEQLLHDVLERLLTRHGIGVTTCSSAIKATDLLAENEYDLVITDFKMPEMDGLELLAHVRQTYPDTMVIMITAHANVQHAVSAMRNGVVDYMPKPFSTEELITRVKKYLTRSKEEARPASEPQKSSKRTTRKKKSKKGGTHFIGEHDSIERLKALIPRVAQSRAPVFVHGESGVGKEILARLVHEESKRADKPYVTINCANLPRELVESHLFGHKKGAFTGAVEDMTGAFERADGGTLLLDEITEIELPVQAKLLRVLQEQEFQKVGESETQKVDVRIIATSNRDLDEAVKDDVFREDLYHRLAVFPVHIPPLRGRISDIPLLAGHFVEKYCKLYDLPPKRVSEELMRRFQGYAWPGNVRQLENMIHRGVVLAADRKEITSDDVVNDFFSDGESAGQSGVQEALAHGEIQTIEDMERQLILQTLSETGNNQREAAERLGISARTIRNKLKKYREEGYAV